MAVCNVLYPIDEIKILSIGVSVVTDKIPIALAENPVDFSQNKEA
jgi:hypothetical protein